MNKIMNEKIREVGTPNSPLCLSLYTLNFYIVFYISHTHHWKYQLAKKKELSIPPIWGCCGPTGGSIFTPGQKNHPAFSEIAAKTHSPFGPYLAGHFACIPPALEKGWMVFLPRGKNRTSSRSTTTPDRWYQKFFFFGQLTLPMMCGAYMALSNPY